MTTPDALAQATERARARVTIARNTYTETLRDVARCAERAIAMSQSGPPDDGSEIHNAAQRVHRSWAHLHAALARLDELQGIVVQAASSSL